MKHLDLCTGLAGFALAARWVGWETIGFSEIDPYCSRLLEKNFPGIPNYGDIRNIDGRTMGNVGIISCGSPCQPYSQAGEQRGEADDRDLWPEFIRLVREVRPSWAIGENVAGFISMGADKLCGDLEGLGYSVEAFVIPACTFRNHRRDRIWITAHAERDEQPRQESRSRTTGRVGREQQSLPWNASWEDAVAHARRVDDGISGRLVTDRTDAIRNAIIPQIAEVIFRAINALR